jgi:hypothetical protein
MQDLDSVFVPRDMELVACRSVEGPPSVGADLRGHAEPAKEAERTTRDGRLGDVEVDSDLAAASQMDAAGGVKEPGELREPVALAPRRDCRELGSEVLRE